MSVSAIRSNYGMKRMPTMQDCSSVFKEELALRDQKLIVKFLYCNILMADEGLEDQ